MGDGMMEQDIIVKQNDYLSHGIMPRGCEDLLWEATLGEYDLDCTVGNGRTPLEAIVDLLDKIEE
jgi:hypothetical protein